MERKIKNYSELLRHGDSDSRKVVLDIAEITLKRLDARNRIKSIMHRDGVILTIGDKKWDLSKKRNIYLIGAGKACNAMAMAVDEILGDFLTDGVAIVKTPEQSDKFSHTRVYVGGHPLPNEAGLNASKEVLKLVDHATAEDLFICVMSGGSSALMSFPVEGISLQEEINTTNVLLKSGASIAEINSVRRHISRVNGGRLAMKIAEKGAELLGINISDSVSRPPTGDISVPCKDFAATPIGPDPTTIEDALHTIEKYALTERIPKGVLSYLRNSGSENETPKSFPQNTYYLLNTLPDSCIYAKEAAESMGLKAFILTTFIETEARSVGMTMASIAKEIQRYHQPFEPPCVILSAGEATTTILYDKEIEGHGGPSQEMVLGFATAASKTNGVCLMSIDSEGTDGTTSVSGGIADSSTLGAVLALGIDPYNSLRTHASFEALSSIASTVITGNTGTNVCDINIMYVPE